MSRPSTKSQKSATSGTKPGGRSLPGDSSWPVASAVAAVLALAIGAVYARALDAPFIFDDGPTIVKNKSIVSLWPLIGAEKAGPLNPERSLPTSGRPLVNLSFAINRYLGGLNPVGYHAVSVGLHYLSAMLLWGIVRRTLRLPYFADRYEASAGWLALAVSLLWALHPLQTETVIYATQRTELMMALFYLATLYCSLRYWSLLPLPWGEGRGEGVLEVDQHRHVLFRRAAWLTLAVVASLCGMASKEVMVTAPLMVLLFERTFVAGSLARSLRCSWPLYAGLAASWLLLAGLNLGAPRSAAAGFGLGPSVFVWWFAQCKVLLMYLKLAVWPWPLLIHYELPYSATLADAWMYVVPVLFLMVATLVLVWRNHPVGYLGAWVFGILAPSSLVPIVLEMAAERRMYLPLAAIVVPVVVGGYVFIQWLWSRWATGEQTRRFMGLARASTILPVVLLAVVYSLVSAHRLAAYDSEANLWREVLSHQPDNYLAHGNLGLLLNDAGRGPEAIHEFQAALALRPDDPSALNNLGIGLTQGGRPAEAIEYLERALRLQPDNAEARSNLGNALNKAGRAPEAIEQLEAAVKLNPDDATTLNNLAIALARGGREAEAIDRLEQLLKLQPGFAEAHNNLGTILTRTNQIEKAIEHFRQAVQLDEGFADAHNNLGIVLAQTGDMEEAIAHFEQAARLQPDVADAQINLGDVLQQMGRPQQAIEHYQAALRINPNNLQTYANLAQTLNLANRSDEAIATAQQGIKVARSAGQAAAAEQIEEWLTRYQTELRRSGDAASTSESSPPTR